MDLGKGDLVGRCLAPALRKNVECVHWVDGVVQFCQLSLSLQPFNPGKCDSRAHSGNCPGGCVVLAAHISIVTFCSVTSGFIASRCSRTSREAAHVPKQHRIPFKVEPILGCAQLSFPVSAPSRGGHRYTSFLVLLGSRIPGHRAKQAKLLSSSKGFTSDALGFAIWQCVPCCRQKHSGSVSYEADDCRFRFGVA